MKRFRTLASALVDADGVPLKPIEELAIVIALAAETIKAEFKQDYDRLQRHTRLMTAGGVVAVILLAGVGIWLLQTMAPTMFFTPGPWVVGAIVAAGLLGMLFFVVRERVKRWQALHEPAAVTRVCRLYWPVGVLPISNDRSIIWDPLASDEAPLTVISVPARLGMDGEALLDTDLKIDQALDALLGFSDALEQIQPEQVQWLGITPDERAQRLGEDITSLAQAMTDFPPAALEVAVPFTQDDDMETLQTDWQAVAQAGETLRDFYANMGEIRERVNRYESLAESLLNAVREVLIDHRWQVVNEVSQDRTRLFSGGEAVDALGGQRLPTLPDQALVLTPTGSLEDVRASLETFQQTLAPLDEAIEAVMARFEQQERLEQQRITATFDDQRRTLDDTKRRLDVLDSEILKLALELDEQQRQIRSLAVTISTGFRDTVAQVPLQASQDQLNFLLGQLEEAGGIIQDVTGKIELPAVEKTLAKLQGSAEKAQAVWHQLATEMPKRSREVMNEIEGTLRILTRIAESPQMENKTTLLQLQDSVKEAEKVVRVVMTWSATRGSPIDAVEEHDRELYDHLLSLREQRRKLENASEIMAALSGMGQGQDVNLIDAIERVEASLATFIRLSEETTKTVGDMDRAAELVRQRAEHIGRLNQERDTLRREYNEQLTALQQAEAGEITALRQKWAGERARVQTSRAEFEQLAVGVTGRTSQERREPALEAMGLIADETPTEWLDLTVNQIGLSIDEWGQRVVGIDAPVGTETLLDRLRADLARCYEEIKARSFPFALDKQAMVPQLCFVPFWYVETKANPGDYVHPGTQVHIYPPLRLKNQTLKDAPQVDALLYPELGRRLMAHLRAGVGNEVPLEMLTFPPDMLTNRAWNLDLASADAPLHEIATALAQQWVFFRSTDRALGMVIQNSRDNLIPEAKLMEAWSRSRNALPGRSGPPAAQLEDDDET